MHNFSPKLTENIFFFKFPVKMLLDWVSPVRKFCNGCHSCIFAGTKLRGRSLKIFSDSEHICRRKWFQIGKNRKSGKTFSSYILFWLQEKQPINFLWTTCRFCVLHNFYVMSYQLLIGWSKMISILASFYTLTPITPINCKSTHSTIMK